MGLRGETVAFFFCNFNFQCLIHLLYWNSLFHNNVSYTLHETIGHEIIINKLKTWMELRRFVQRCVLFLPHCRAVASYRIMKNPSFSNDFMASRATRDSHRLYHRARRCCLGSDALKLYQQYLMQISWLKRRIEAEKPS